MVQRQIGMILLGRFVTGGRVGGDTEWQKTEKNTQKNESINLIDPTTYSTVKGSHVKVETVQNQIRFTSILCCWSEILVPLMFILEQIHDYFECIGVALCQNCRKLCKLLSSNVLSVFNNHMFLFVFLCLLFSLCPDLFCFSKFRTWMWETRLSYQTE